MLYISNVYQQHCDNKIYKMLQKESKPMIMPKKKVGSDTTYMTYNMNSYKQRKHNKKINLQPLSRFLIVVFFFKHLKKGRLPQLLFVHLCKIYSLGLISFLTYIGQVKSAYHLILVRLKLFVYDHVFRIKYVSVLLLYKSIVFKILIILLVYSTI